MQLVTGHESREVPRTGNSRWFAQFVAGPQEGL